MSRWGVEQPARDAFQFVLDPATEGESLSDQDRHHIENDLARAQIRQMLKGLGYHDLASEGALSRSAAELLARRELGQIARFELYSGRPANTLTPRQVP
jgi:hypothetical protein